MNNILADFITIFLALLFMKSFFDAYFDESKHIDLTKYITLEKNYYKPIQQARPATQIKRKPAAQKKQSCPTKTASVNADLRNDCDMAMKSLGTDAQQRKYLLKSIFDIHQPKTVQEFLKLAFSNLKI